MASMRSCPDCKRRISYSASTCPGCGCDIEGITEQSQLRRSAYCEEHGINESQYLRHYFKSIGYDFDEMEEKEKEEERKSKEIAKNKEKRKKLTQQRIEKKMQKELLKQRKMPWLIDTYISEKLILSLFSSFWPQSMHHLFSQVSSFRSLTKTFSWIE